MTRDDVILLKRTVTHATNEIEPRSALHAFRAAEFAGVVITHDQVFKRQLVAHPAGLQLDAASLRAIGTVNVRRAGDRVVRDDGAAAVAYVADPRRAVDDFDAEGEARQAIVLDDGIGRVLNINSLLAG